MSGIVAWTAMNQDAVNLLTPTRQCPNGTFTNTIKPANTR